MSNKCRRAISGIAGTLMMSGIAQAGFINGSFESGSLYGWQTQMTGGLTGRPAQAAAGGGSQIVAGAEWHAGATFSLAPQTGERFALLAPASGSNRSGSQKFQISLSQTIELSGGATVSGWAAFFNGNRSNQDHAWVRIYDAAGNLVATPWQAVSGRNTDSEFCLTPYRSASDWTAWSWQALEDASYTVRLGLMTEGDQDNASYGFFDHLFVSGPVAVPEPNSLSLLALAGGLAGVVRRHSTKRL